VPLEWLLGDYKAVPRTPVRVALLGVSPLLQEMLESASDTDVVIEVDGYFLDPERLIQALPRTSSDVLLVAAGALGTADVARRCLAVSPTLAVVTLTRGGRDATLYHLTLASRTVEDVSAAGLIDLIDQARSLKW
jgi:UDP-N-acetyl-D-mannosaminuronic acid transferase (WecB/TagA/CpsF family)